MKGEVFIGKLQNHAVVINKHAAMLNQHQQGVAYLSTRMDAAEQVLTASRWSFLRVALREVFRPGSFLKALDEAQQALLAPLPAKKAQEPKTSTVTVTAAPADSAAPVRTESK
jgi:hypothetical protein